VWNRSVAEAPEAAAVALAGVSKVVLKLVTVVLLVWISYVGQRSVR
jgi:hypothetical protein